MPRRVHTFSVRLALDYSAVTWKGLSSQQQKAPELLGITKKVWNSDLAPFYDDLWTVEHYSMNAVEFSPVLSLIRKMAQKPLYASGVVQFLLGLDRVLTPSQGRAICKALKDGACWQTLSNDFSKTRYFNIHVLVASFLSYPGRFLDMSFLRTQGFWDDDQSGCAWGNASATVDSTPSVPTYLQALQVRGKKRAGFRLWAGSILTGQLPATSKIGGDPLPALDRDLTLHILSDWIQDESIDPKSVSWVTDYHNHTIYSFLA